MYRRQAWLRVFVGFMFCSSLQTVSPVEGALQAQQNLPAVTEPLPPGVDHLQIAPLPEVFSDGMSTGVGNISQIAEPIVASTPVSTGREVSWRKLPGNVLHDQKDIWLFPVQLARGRHWLPTVVVIGVTAGLLTLDAHDVAYFRRTNTFYGFNTGFSGTITEVEIGAAPAVMYAVGLMRRDSYAQETALLSGEAFIDSGILSVAMKDVSRRLRPSDIAPNGDFSDTFFRTPASITGSGSAFPSGHSILAFSVATVMARRYGKNHRWVPWVAYGAAGAIGLSRITLQAHFPSDVFLGAALGYAVARFDVLRNL